MAIRNSEGLVLRGYIGTITPPRFDVPSKSCSSSVIVVLERWRQIVGDIVRYVSSVSQNRHSIWRCKTWFGNEDWVLTRIDPLDVYNNRCKNISDSGSLERANSNYAANNFAQLYSEITDDLVVRWLDIGEEFVLHEYNGLESLRKKGIIMFFAGCRGLPRVILKTYIWKELSKALEFSHLILSTADTSKEKRYSENAELLEQCCLLHRFTFRTFCALFGSCTQHPLQTVDKASQSSLVGD